MDPAVIQAILARQGAPDTQGNVNRIIEFAGANPDVAERYSRGSPVPVDDNSALLRLALEKSIQKTGVPPVPQGDQAPMPQKAPAPVAPRGAPPARAPAPVAAPSRQGGYGPGQAMPTRDSQIPMPAQPAPSGGTGWEWLLGPLLRGILGAGDKGNFDMSRFGAGSPPAAQNVRGQEVPTDARGWPPGTEAWAEGAPRAPAPYATDMPAPIAPKPSGGTAVPATPLPQTPQDVTRMENEVRQENAAAREAAMRQAEEGSSKLKAQMQTRDTIKRAQKSIGRHP